VLKLKKQIDYWKDQAGLPAHKRDYVDLENIKGAPPAAACCVPSSSGVSAGYEVVVSQNSTLAVWFVPDCWY
jgi:hypothetical protein